MDEQQTSVCQLVLDEIQSAFPLAVDPHAVLAQRLGLTRAQVIDCIAQLREEGTIRSVGASLSSKHLGYVSSLCALAVQGTQEEIDHVASLVNKHVEITHNYLREARYNVWFTVIAPSHEEIQRVLDEIRTDTGCDDIINLPATALYKVRVDFSRHGATAPKPAETAPDEIMPFNCNDAFDLALIRWAQGDVWCEYPFAQVPGYPDEQRVLQRLKQLIQNGTIRRFGAFVQHRKMGYAFNAMTVWDAPASQAEQLGHAFAEKPYISHCYERPHVQTWPYNLYAMVHAKTQEELNGYLEELRQLSGLQPLSLVSTKEYKKTRAVYFPESNE